MSTSSHHELCNVCNVRESSAFIRLHNPPFQPAAPYSPVVPSKQGLSPTATNRYKQNTTTMPTFPSKKYRPASSANTLSARYRVALVRHPFAAFGLPFLITMVAGSFFLTPATAIRYEKHDRKVRQLSKEEELGIGKAGRKVDLNEEYYVCFFPLPNFWRWGENPGSRGREGHKVRRGGTRVGTGIFFGDWRFAD